MWRSLALLTVVACGSPHDATIDAPSAADATAIDGAADTTGFSFVVVGCNRLEKADITPGNPSTANLAQLDRTFADIAALSPPPAFLFFAGDMVYGYKDATTLEPELTAWLAHYTASALPALGVELVPVPGNHEMEAKTSTTKLAYAQAEATWVTVMGSKIRAANGPGPGGLDGLQTDQRKLTYSFDHQGTHFIVLDTDPVGGDGSAPSHWIAADAAAARAAGAKHIFAIGHKPAFPSPLSTEGGFTDPANRDAVWSALEASHAEAMLSAHNHLWFKTRPNKTWQIVAGNGGSLLESNTTGVNAYYGFTVVHVGVAVSVTSYGRDVPASSYFGAAPAAQYPTTIRDTTDVTWQ